MSYYYITSPAPGGGGQPQYHVQHVAHPQPAPQPQPQQTQPQPQQQPQQQAAVVHQQAAAQAQQVTVQAGHHYTIQTAQPHQTQQILVSAAPAPQPVQPLRAAQFHVQQQQHEEPPQQPQQQQQQQPQRPTIPRNKYVSSRVMFSDHASLLLNGLRRLLETGEGSDLEIRCNDEEFHVHKAVLSCFTDYFRDSDGVWVRINVDSNCLRKLLTFLYIGEVSVNYDEMDKFLATCRALNVKLFRDAEVSEYAVSAPEEAPRPVVAAERPTEERYELNEFELVCQACYKIFPSKKKLYNHKSFCQKPKDKQCNYCEKKFLCNAEVEQHERIHTGEKPFVCEHCEAAFRGKMQLKEHVQRVHEGVRYKCEFCEKEFPRKQQLNLHKASAHETVRPHACLLCGACFARKSLLTAHKRLSHKNGKTAVIQKRRRGLALKKGKTEPGMPATNSTGVEGVEDDDEQVAGDAQVSDTLQELVEECQIQVIVEKQDEEGHHE